MREQLRNLVADMVRHGVTLETAMREFERIYLEAVLDASDGNQSAAARRLGIHRNTLSRKLEPAPSTLRKASLAS
jgi:DNA-binding NtrC family response regulator